MRIAIDLRPYMSGKITGIEVYIKSMLEALFELDQKNEYVLWYNTYKSINTDHFPKEQSNVQILRTKIPNKWFNLSLSYFRRPKIDQLIQKKTGKPIDILWVPDPRPAPVSDQCKKVTTFHDLSFEDFKYSFNAKTRLWHKILKPRQEAEEADKIIAVSQFTKGQLVSEYDIDDAKIEVILEAASPHLKPLELPRGLELIQRKYQLPKEYFLCLSTVEPRKNITGVIETYLKWQQETSAEVHLVVAGKQYPSIFSEAQLKDHPMVHFPGFIDEEDKSLLYQHAQGFLYPSFYEGFGLPVLEAMQCGTPVITSDATAMPEVAGDAALLVNPNEPHELKEAMHNLHRDERLRQELIEKGFKQAARFSWSKAAKQLLKQFESLG